MPDFNDLPKAVRQKIYALHLTFDKPVTSSKHNKVVKFHHSKCWGPDKQKYFLPPLLTLSPQIEKEAAPYYYANNHFDMDGSSSFMYYTSPLHLKMVRKATVLWDRTGAGYMFKSLNRLKGLKELRIRVDELELLRNELNKGKGRRARRSVLVDPSPQQQLAILNAPGMSGLMSVHKVRHVEFIKKLKPNTGAEYGGPIPGGVLQTQIAPKLMGRKPKAPAKPRGKKAFPFLSLSAELRNQIYELHLTVPGAVHPSTKAPTSASKNAARYGEGKVPESALSLLAVNRQIHDEAVGIFYNSNALVFPDTLHLHAFMLCLGSQRLESVRDITLHYADLSTGGLSLTELTFGQLKRLTNLRRLQIIMQGDLSKKIISRRCGQRHLMDSANPASIAGMRELFDLRNITDIQVKDEVLGSLLEIAKKSDKYPDFPATTENACVVKVHQALEHFNLALAEAQKGNVQDEILDDDKWHLAKVFPSLDFAEEEEEVELEEDDQDVGSAHGARAVSLEL
ncbi:hypothetical protein LTR17_013683 [Elasticomyces elasticus]|nr:hypothetical protein LTR17_013683 [Elasticomyces elasticus]